MVKTMPRQFTSGGLGRLQILELPSCRQTSRKGDENKQSPTIYTLSQISPSPENSAPQQPNNKCKDRRTNYCPYDGEPLAPYGYSKDLREVKLGCEPHPNICADEPNYNRDQATTQVVAG